MKGRRDKKHPPNVENNYKQCREKEYGGHLMDEEREKRRPEFYSGDGSGGGRRSFTEKCRHLGGKQRAKFYILRRCIAMLVCGNEKNESRD
ncbi:hypothetical protein M569_13802 [Genlisea aurea]|uniref:Uncharacterized protein n=1 Tax=Genlisea aurea TaxID=192259 RepID=S8C2W8_9LAMI|nr:hypothetical protein M569_13802 [Genlisea aurea]